MSSSFSSLSRFAGTRFFLRFLRKWNFGEFFRFELPDCWLPGLQQKALAHNISAPKIYKTSPFRLKAGFPAKVGVKASDLELAGHSQHRLQLLLGHLPTTFITHVGFMGLSPFYSWVGPRNVGGL